MRLQSKAHIQHFFLIHWHGEFLLKRKPISFLVLCNYMDFAVFLKVFPTGKLQESLLEFILELKRFNFMNLLYCICDLYSHSLFYYGSF